MKRRKRRGKSEKLIPRGRMDEFDVAVLTGSTAGAAIGAIAGPPGIAAGSLLGAAAGVAAGVAMKVDEARHRGEAARLDATIGVIGGNMGAARPDQPPAKIGAYSAGSAGAATSGSAPSEGPMQNVDEG